MVYGGKEKRNVNLMIANIMWHLLGLLELLGINSERFKFILYAFHFAYLHVVLTFFLLILLD